MDGDEIRRLLNIPSFESKTNASADMTVILDASGLNLDLRPVIPTTYIFLSPTRQKT
jgi:hypothetical protein